MKAKQVRRRTGRWRTVFILSVVSLLAGCARPFHPTPLDTLTEFPGYLVKPDMYVEESVEVLQEQEVAGGLVLLYRWQSPESQKTGTYCVATTFVKPTITLQGKGWQARTSTFLTAGSEARSPVRNRRCEVAAGAFVAGYIVRGDEPGDKVTTTSGFSQRGATVRVVWSDGQNDIMPLENNSFFLARPGEHKVQRIELLDVDGNVLESREW